MSVPGRAKPARELDLLLPTSVNLADWQQALADPGYALLVGETRRPALCLLRGGLVHFVDQPDSTEPARRHAAWSEGDAERGRWAFLTEKLPAELARFADLTFAGALDPHATMFTIHDLLEYRGSDLRHFSFEARRQHLEQLLGELPSPFHGPGWAIAALWIGARARALAKRLSPSQHSLRRLDAPYRITQWSERFWLTPSPGA